MYKYTTGHGRDSIPCLPPEAKAGDEYCLEIVLHKWDMLSNFVGLMVK